MGQETIAVDDAIPLALTVWDAAAPRANVVIGGAMGAPQDFYAPFARWLCGQGWRVTTFDYRGIGRSRPANGGLRGFRADLFDWARDYAAVIDHAQAARPELPLYLVGHSLGAQLPGMLANQRKVSGLLAVAAGSGYWRETAPRVRPAIPLFWFLLVPLATAACGFFPGRRLRLIGDVPAGVMFQWRRWCLDPHYSAGAEGKAVRQRYAAARFPVHAISIDDDDMVTLQGLRSLMTLYANAPGAVERVAPRTFAIARIGHFGAFRREREPDLWPHLARRLVALQETP
jgi:predicted alpha/beta hydrolase